MLQLYSYDNNKLIINDSFSQLWSIMKFKGKYIRFPEETEQIIKTIPNKVVMKGKLSKNKKFYFNETSNDIIINNFGNEIQLSVDYDYEIEWEIKSHCKNNNNNNIGFYSPYRKFSTDRLYLNFDKKCKKLTEYKSDTGKFLISCHILVIALDKYHSDTDIILNINPIMKNINKQQCHQLEYCNVKVFDVKKEGIFYRPLIKEEFKKLYCLVRKHYEITSIERSNYKHLTKEGYLLLPKEVDYTQMLTKISYGSIFTLTSNIQPISDRIGYYGIIIKRDPNIISSATIYYEFEFSNIRETQDIIVTAAYYQANEGYVPHQIYDKNKNKYVYVMNTCDNGPYPNKNNYITGQLDLESTSVDIILIISNSLYGLLPINENFPIGKFNKFNIEYNNIER